MRLRNGIPCNDIGTVVRSWIHEPERRGRGGDGDHRMLAPYVVDVIVRASRRFEPATYLRDVCVGPWSAAIEHERGSVIRFDTQDGVLSASLVRHIDGQWRIHLLLTHDHPDVNRTRKQWKAICDVLNIDCVSSKRTDVMFTVHPPSAMIDLRLMWMSTQLCVELGPTASLEYNYPPKPMCYWEIGSAHQVTTMLLSVMGMRYRLKGLADSLMWVRMEPSSVTAMRTATLVEHIHSELD